MTAFSLRLTNGANAVSASSTRRPPTRPGSGITRAADPGHHQRRPCADLGRHGDARALRAPSRRGPRRPRRRQPQRPLLGADGRVPDARAVGGPPRQKLELAIFARRPAAQPVRPPWRGAGDARGARDGARPAILTIGFARRFATYKRAALLFTDIDRLARLLWDADRPVQVVFAGKAHPADRPGQRVIQEIFTRSRSPKLRGRVFILEDYDMRDRPLPRPGRRRLAQQPAPSARGVGHERHEGGHERRRQRVGPRRLVGRGLDRRQRLGDRRPRQEPRRRRPGLGRRPGSLPDPRGGGRAALLRPRRDGLPRAGSS